MKKGTQKKKAKKNYGTTEKKSKEEKKAYILFNQDFNVIINVENVKWFR